MDKKSNNLLLFENDLHIETLKNILPKYENTYIILLKNEQRQIKLSESVIQFKQEIITEFIELFDNLKQIDASSLQSQFEDITKLDLVYQGIGENNDFINDFKITNNKKIFNLVRDEDLFAWKFAKKGFFKFKENIPKINQKIVENFKK